MDPKPSTLNPKHQKRLSAAGKSNQPLMAAREGSMHLFMALHFDASHTCTQAAGAQRGSRSPEGPGKGDAELPGLQELAISLRRAHEERDAVIARAGDEPPDSTNCVCRGREDGAPNAGVLLNPEP
jgi:hypothetical protein